VYGSIRTQKGQRLSSAQHPAVVHRFTFLIKRELFQMNSTNNSINLDTSSMLERENSLHFFNTRHKSHSKSHLKIQVPHQVPQQVPPPVPSPTSRPKSHAKSHLRTQVPHHDPSPTSSPTSGPRSLLRSQVPHRVPHQVAAGAPYIGDKEPFSISLNRAVFFG
jgi:hypothetical protein